MKISRLDMLHFCIQVVFLESAHAADLQLIFIWPSRFHWKMFIYCQLSKFLISGLSARIICFIGPAGPFNIFISPAHLFFHRPGPLKNCLCTVGTAQFNVCFHFAGLAGGSGTRLGPSYGPCRSLPQLYCKKNFQRILLVFLINRVIVSTATK